jgi:ATP-dependent Clp protease ATP-binding subunit ClpA
LDNAKKHKKEYGDEFVSVEHILQAFTSDKRFGQQLFKDLKIVENDLKEAISAVRGSQRVTDQSTFRAMFFSFYCLFVFAGFFCHRVLVVSVFVHNFLYFSRNLVDPDK